MSNAIRSPVGIVLAVFLAMVGRPLACRAVNAPYFRKSAADLVVDGNRAAKDYRQLDHHHNIFSPKEEPSFMEAPRNDYSPKKCRAEGAERLERSKAKRKLLSWLNYKNAVRQKQLGQYKQDLQRNTKEREREVDRQRQRIERIQNEAADRQFARLVTSGQHRRGFRVDHAVSGDAMRYNIKANAFCNVPKAKVQYNPSRASPRTGTIAQAAPTWPTTKCASDGTNGRLTEAERLLKIIRRMKKRARLIIKTLNALDSQIVKCWPESDNRDAPGKKAAHLTTSLPPQVSTQKKTKCWKQASPIKERLELPTPSSATMLQSKYSRGFYFGLSPPGHINTKQIMDAALQEEQKLEQKVREEYQMEQENFVSETERRQNMNINKSKGNQQIVFGVVPEKRSAVRDQILSQQDTL